MNCKYVFSKGKKSGEFCNKNIRNHENLGFCYDHSPKKKLRQSSKCLSFYGVQGEEIEKAISELQDKKKLEALLKTVEDVPDLSDATFTISGESVKSNSKPLNVSQN